MKRFLIAAVIGLSVFTGATLTATHHAEAARPRVSIAFAGSSSDAVSAASTTASADAAGEVSFAVTATLSKESDLYLLWVANKCFSAGTLVSAEYKPVSSGAAGPFTVPDGADSCTAYVWSFPNSETPIKGASMSYAAN